MILHGVQAFEFRSYRELTFSFRKNGLTLIDAPNMYGKSTIMDAVFWALYGWLPRWKGPKGGPADAVIRRGQKTCTVRVTFYNNGHEVIVERSRPNKVRVWKDAVEQQGKSDDLNQKIEELAGMTASQFLVSVYFSQDRSELDGIYKPFFTMGDNDRTKLLSVIAGLEDLDRGLDRAKAERDRITPFINRVDGAYAATMEALNGIPLRKERFEAELVNRNSILETARERHSLEVGARDEQVAERKAWLKTNFDVIDAGRVQAAEPLHQKIAEIEKALGELNASSTTPKMSDAFTIAVAEAKSTLASAEAFNREQEKNERINKDIRQAIAKDIAKAEQVATEGKCGECKQELPHWNPDSAMRPYLDHAERIEKEIREIAPLIDTTPLQLALEAAVEAYTREKARLEEHPNKVRSEISTLTQEKNNAQLRLRILDQEADALKKRMQAAVDNTLAESMKLVLQAERELQDAKFHADTALGSLKLIDEEQKEKELQAARYDNEKANLQKEMNLALDLIEVFGPKGLRSICFDGLVERIASRANQLLSSMTDGAYGTRIDQIAEDSKGSSKMILKPIVFKGGETVPMDDLSGGAKRRFMLAYDIAVSDCMADGAPLLLDEALDGLDPSGKTEVMVLLDEVARTRPVLVIDHGTEFKASFSAVVKVNFKDDISSLEGQENQEVKGNYGT